MTNQGEAQVVQFPGLNGLRAFAAISVVASHILHGLTSLGLPKHGGLELAGAAVTMFFTLSGFLITYLLLAEKARHGQISLSKFYVRRILRIWPLYFFYIGLVVATLGVGRSGAWMLLYVVFLANLAFNLNLAPNGLFHLWSVAIEEQFYAFWPLVVQRVRRLQTFLICFIVVIVGMRVGAKLWSIRIHDKLPFSIAECMRFDCMATGALFALLYRTRDRFRAWLAASWLPPIAFWTIAVLAALDRLHALSLVGDNVVALVTAMFIIHEIEKGTRITALENPVMSFLGKISYGIYVYHPLVIALLGIALTKSARALPSVPAALVCVAGITVLVSWLSYRFIERPFLQRKARFARVASGTP